MAKKYKDKFNPHSLTLQKVLNDENLAQKEHNHSISDVEGLQIILNQLTDGTPISVLGGYFAN